MAFWHKPAYNLTEAEIRYAMANSTSNTDAAAFLHISPSAYKKYAEKYYDANAGKSLYELHKNQAGKRTFKKKRASLAPLEDIFAGKYPKYNTTKLKKRIIEEGAMDEICSMCGFKERRISDYSVPIVLVWKDGNKRNHVKENLEFVCYNCYHLYYGDMKQRAYIIIKDV